MKRITIINGKIMKFNGRINECFEENVNLKRERDLMEKK